jgi:hypothetical protein
MNPRACSVEQASADEAAADAAATDGSASASTPQIRSASRSPI